MISKRHFLSLLAVASAAAAFSPAVRAAFPERPVRIVVPFAPGGPVDLTARILAQHMSDALGQQVIVDNRPGGATLIGAALVAKSEKDGYTLLMTGGSTIVTAPLMYKKMQFRVEDFAPVGMVGKFPFVLLSRPALPATSVKQFAEHAKGTNINFGHTGAGSTSHLLGELVNAAMGINMQGVPYKGTAQAMTDILGDRLDVSVDALQAAVPNHLSKKVRILATTGAERSPLVPDVPTFAESGYPNLTLYFWTGLFAPAGTPPAAIARLNEATRKALANEDLQKRLVAAGQIPSPGLPAELGSVIAKDIALWGPIIKKLGVQLEE